MAIDRQRRPGRHLGRFRLRHDQRTQPPHFLMQQAHGALVGIIGRKLLEQTSSASPSVWCAGSCLRPRISDSRTRTPACANCHAASVPGHAAADDMDLMMGHWFRLNFAYFPVNGHFRSPVDIMLCVASSMA